MPTTGQSSRRGCLLMAGTLAGPAALGVFVVALAVVAGSATSIVAGAPGGVPSEAARARIPAATLSLYEQAAATCPGMPWTVLAAVGTLESDNGTSDAPGVSSGSNPSGAEGPMQMLPFTFAQYATAGPGGAVPPSPYDLVDAIYSAARMLCANGAGDPTRVAGAVFAYNHDDGYVREVLDLASSFAAPSGAGAPALNYAIAQLGTPYRWGGESPGVAFDCSGLVQAAYAAAGVALPRVAQDQFDAGPRLAPGTPLAPGDLVFFGTGPKAVDHVGLFEGPATMVDAPHTGAPVRTDRFDPVVGASWGAELYLGATRPG